MATGAHLYLTPEEAIARFEEKELIEATTLRNSGAAGVDMERLVYGCETTTAIINGYLALVMDISDPTGFSEAFQLTLQQHAANMLMDVLGVGTADARQKREVTVEWLEFYVKTQTENKDGTGVLPVSGETPAMSLAFGSPPPRVTRESYADLWG
ncbi:MAG: hypothetical protein AAGF24_03235 [Cyanobacteria bacterium P01_H01_bin.121]